jgi:hypothetical protein
MSNEEMSEKLTNSVLEWWEYHQHDVYGYHGEYNTYPEEPDFVILAKHIKNTLVKSDQ